MEWIDLNEKVPAEDTRVLLWSDHENPDWSCEKIGSFLNGRFYARGGIDYKKETVTHWMPLPDPPKEFVEQSKTK